MAQAALVPAQLPSSGIDIAHVSKSFVVNGEPVEALRDISLSVEPGSFVTLVGPSGCGKSTLLRLIVGFETADSGTIRVGGRPVRRPGLDRGMVFQDHRLFPWLTVERNILLSMRRIRYPDSEKRKIVRDLIALVGLTGFERAHPHQLSGGMSQRAAIARALAPGPRILLLDEPLGALDSLTRTHLQAEFLRIWKHEGITMLMVTHDVEEAIFLSDRIVVIEPRPGRVRRSFDIPLEHPRRRSDPIFVALKEEILGHLNAAE
ncbi:MAG TPA: ABC transporter ATP-binding protein [Xanthobacteraceae bacterium]|jgi:ABC-type nitrate/sulfonate/bicarbonate transport system ATPase subunit|nr:ABC transporter ATP-binding protein [Xanthobacteraceae bacterium]